MLTFRILSIFAMWSTVAAVGYYVLARWSQQDRSRRRLWTDAHDQTPPALVSGPGPGLLQRWLFLAGFRNEAAAAVFILASLLAAALGLGLVVAMLASDLLVWVARNAALVPGGLGEVAASIAYLAPWLVFLVFASAPILVVRRARRRRVEAVERDLPLTLDLLATLSDAGMSFDAGLARVMDTQVAVRPLGREIRTFQSDLIAGRSRIEALRRLARRLEVQGVTILVSALVQAEQLGSGIAEVLRRQAEDLRMRRRERANAFAMTLPVKRMFPLVICFLPGIFVWTLGPFFAQLFQMADSLMQVRGL